MSWIFIFNFKLSKKEPFQIREQKKQRRNWLVLEQDIRVVKSGG
jgi:hypothetical protein